MSSWRPNLPESRLFAEKAFLQGVILLAVTYGVALVLFILIIPLLIMRIKGDIKRDGRTSRLTICLLIFVCATFILSTLSMASQAEVTQLSFIENRDFPGGPAAYQKLMVSIPISNLQNYCNFLMNWFSDGLLLWRCSVIYGGSRTSVWLVMAIPGLLMLASIVTGAIFLERISRTSFSPWTDTGFKFSLIYGAVTICLNTVLIIMLVVRLYLHRRRLRKILGPRHAAHYTKLISMRIESSSLMTPVVIWFLISFVMGSPLAIIPLSIIFQVQVVASYMIIFRVAQGTAWTSQTAETDFDVHEHVDRPSNIPASADSRVGYQVGQ